jgi:hypothetical protein
VKRGPKLSPRKLELFREVHAGKRDYASVAAELHVSKAAVTMSYGRWVKKGGGNPVLTPSTPPPIIPPTPAPVRPPEVPRVPTLEDVLRGPTPGAPPLIPPAPPPGPSEIDLAAARMGKRVVLKIRAGLVRYVIRSFGVSPNDPDIVELLPKDMQQEGPKGGTSWLDMALEENADKTQFAGKIFKGWKGIIMGTIFETIDIVGLVRQIAILRGIKMPEDGPENPPPPKPTPPAAPAPGTGSDGKFDLTQRLMQIQTENLRRGH